MSPTCKHVLKPSHLVRVRGPWQTLEAGEFETGAERQRRGRGDGASEGSRGEKGKKVPMGGWGAAEEGPPLSVGGPGG